MSQFFFRWSDYTENTWNESYAVNDEELAFFEVSQTENDFAQLSAEIKHPHIGLLNTSTAAGRKVWAWLSYQADDTAGTIYPLFFGRLVGIPDSFSPTDETITIVFQARPSDFNTRKVNAALDLMTAPNYDPVFVDPDKRLSLATDGYRGDPDTVLQGWSKLWSIDRVTGTVSASDILEGEDGTEIFDAEDILTGLQISFSENPLAALTVVGKVDWTQQDSGTLDLGDKFFYAYNGLAIKNDWPKPGQSLSGGWKVDEATYAIDINGIEGAQVKQYGFNYENKDTTHRNGDVMSIHFQGFSFPATGISFTITQTVQNGHRPGGWEDFANDILIGDEVNQNIPLHYNANIMLIAAVPVRCGLTLGFDAGIKRSETITIKMVANLQPIVTLPDPDEVTETISLNGTDVGLPIDGDAPIGALSGSNYFPTSRGQQSLEYLLCVAMAHFKQRARAIRLTADISFDRAIGLSCRKNATLNAPQLPGGTATGKIISYSFSASGNDAELKGSVTIGCCIGYGLAVDAVAGSPTYVEDGVLADGVQAMEGGTTSLGSVGYTPPVYTPGPDDITFPLQKSQVVVNETVTSSTTQVQAGEIISQFTLEKIPNIVTVPTSVYTLELLPLTGALDSTYDLTSTPVELPKQIDLEAASNG